MSVQCSADFLGVKMCSLSAPATLAVLWLPLIISSALGDKVLSHRQFDYSTTTCILDNPENQEIEDANLEECENKCSCFVVRIISTFLLVSEALLELVIFGYQPPPTTIVSIGGCSFCA